VEIEFPLFEMLGMRSVSDFEHFLFSEKMYLNPASRKMYPNTVNTSTERLQDFKPPTIT
jgi:hypothetical protein